MNQEFYNIALSFIPGIGNVSAKNLISYCGSAEQVFKETRQALIKIPNIGPQIIAEIRKQNTMGKAEKELAFNQKNDIAILFYTSKRYPRRLKECLDAPILLYQKGDTDLNAGKVISIVGTRRASKYGRDFVELLLHQLKKSGVQVLSGMALGIDAQAHKSSLNNNLETIGILGHGLHTMYPGEHIKLGSEILKNKGSLLTENNTQEPLIPANFPRRNRIIAGMSDAVIVVESGLKGGSMITANLGNSYNRDVFAMPGRYKDKFSQGCNFLIKTHRAQIIENAQDLLQQMGWENNNSPPKTTQKQLLLHLNEREQKVVSLLQEHEFVEGDIMATKMGMRTSELAGIILELELKGIIRSLPGNAYSLD